MKSIAIILLLFISFGLKGQVNGFIRQNSSANQTFSGVIASGYNLTKTGSNTLTLTGANTYTGLTQVNTGNLQIGNAGTTGSLATPSVINNGTLTILRNDTNLSVISVIPNITGITSTGNVVITNGVDGITYDRNITANNITTSAKLVTGAIALSLVNGTTFNATGTHTITGDALNVNNGRGIQIVNGTINFNGNTVLNGSSSNTTQSFGIVLNTLTANSTNGSLTFNGNTAGNTAGSGTYFNVGNYTTNGDINVTGVQTGTTATNVDVHTGGVFFAGNTTFNTTGNVNINGTGIRGISTGSGTVGLIVPACNNLTSLGTSNSNLNIGSVLRTTQVTATNDISFNGIGQSGAYFQNTTTFNAGRDLTLLSTATAGNGLQLASAATITTGRDFNITASAAGVNSAVYIDGALTTNIGRNININATQTSTGDAVRFNIANTLSSVGNINITASSVGMPFRASSTLGLTSTTGNININLNGTNGGSILFSGIPTFNAVNTNIIGATLPIATSSTYAMYFPAGLNSTVTGNFVCTQNSGYIGNGAPIRTSGAVTLSGNHTFNATRSNVATDATYTMAMWADNGLWTINNGTTTLNGTSSASTTSNFGATLHRITTAGNGTLVVNGTSTGTGHGIYIDVAPSWGNTGGTTLTGLSTNANGVRITQPFTVSNTVVINGTSTNSSSTLNNYGIYPNGITITATGDLTLNGTATTGTGWGLNLPIAISNAGVLRLGCSGVGNSVVNGAISGVGSVVKEGTSALAMNVAHTYSGGTVINNGTVFFPNAGTIAYLGSGGITINPNGVLSTNAWRGASGVMGAVNLNGGTFRMSGGNSFGTWRSAITLNANSTIDFVGTGFMTILGNVNINGFALNLNSTNLAGNNVISGIISGTGTINKTNTSDVLLSGANTFTADLNINAGLISSGSATALGTTGNVVVNSGGTLTFTVNNTATKTITVNAGGVINRGGFSLSNITFINNGGTINP